MNPDAYNPALDQKANEQPPRCGVGSFGQVLFQVSEEVLSVVSNVQRKTVAKVEEHQVVGAKPRLEFIAPILCVTTFKVFWNCLFGVNPRDEIRTLRELCEKGAAQRLILGGENFGKYVLTEVAETWNRCGPDGAPMTAEASLTFKEYQ
jgi:phage protein U